MEKTETPAGSRRTTRGIGAGAPGKPRPVQKKSGSKAAASKKEKAPSRVGAHFLHSRVYQTSNCIVN